MELIQGPNLCDISIFLKWYISNVPFPQYNVPFMFYCVVISLVLCFLNFTPQKEALDENKTGYDMCIRFDIALKAWGGRGWDMLAVGPLVNFLQIPF